MNNLTSILLETLSYWWVIFPLIFIVIIRDWWIVNVTEKYVDSIEWTLLEIIIPKDNLKSAKAMEQVIAALHATYSFGISKKDLYTKGKVEDWMSLEIAGFSDGIHLYIRTPNKHRKLVESSVLAQYPDAEIIEADDYVERLKEKPFSDRDIFGSDFVTVGPAALPIRTYEFFEDKDDERRLDPLATITEIMTELEKNEALWIQLLIRPTGDSWKEAAKDKVEELLGNKSGGGKSSTSVWKDIGDVVANLPSAMFEPPAFAEGGDSGGGDSKKISSTDQDAVKAIGMKTSKLAFDCLLRVVYIDDKDEFTGDNVTATMGAIRQFGDQNLNQLVPNMDTMTVPAGRFNKKKTLAHRKRVLMINYIKRTMPRIIKLPFWDTNLKTCILNTEEIATLFHPPTDVIKSRKLEAIHSRKGMAPIDLPVKERK